MFLHFEDTVEPTSKENDDTEQILGAIMLQQYSLKSGLRIFGEKGEHAVSSDLNQIYDIDTFTPIDASNISRKKR